MTPSDAPTLGFAGAPRPARPIPRPGGNPVASERLRARRQRTRAIRRWVITGAVVLFIALAVVISTQMKFASTSVASTSSSGTSSSGTSGSGTSGTSSSGTSGTPSSASSSQSSGTTSSVTTSQS